MGTGDLTWEGAARECDGCGHPHGPLYICEHYPAELSAKLRADTVQLQRNLRNPKWLAEQKQRGATDEELAIMKLFVGEESN